MIKSNHNHSFILVDAHSILRKMIMISEIKNDIFRQLNVQISSAKVFFALRVFDSIIEVNFSNSKDSKIVNFMFKIRDIYNLKTELRREILNSFTFVQTLIRELDQDD
jgi:hypothetical protein